MIRNRNTLSLVILLTSILLLSTVCMASQTFVMQWEKSWVNSIEPVFSEDGGVLLVSGKKTSRISSDGKLMWEWNTTSDITCIADDKKGGAWVAHDGNISKLNNKGSQTWLYAHNDYISAMEGLPSGELTAGTDKGVLLLDGKGKKLWFFDPTAGCDI